MRLTRDQKQRLAQLSPGLRDIIRKTTRKRRWYHRNILWRYRYWTGAFLLTTIVPSIEIPGSLPRWDGDWIGGVGTVWALGLAVLQYQQYIKQRREELQLEIRRQAMCVSAWVEFAGEPQLVVQNQSGLPVTHFSFEIGQEWVTYNMLTPTTRPTSLYEMPWQASEMNYDDFDIGTSTAADINDWVSTRVIESAGTWKINFIDAQGYLWTREAHQQLTLIARLPTERPGRDVRSLPPLRGRH